MMLFFNRKILRVELLLIEPDPYGQEPKPSLHHAYTWRRQANPIKMFDEKIAKRVKRKILHTAASAQRYSHGPASYTEITLNLFVETGNWRAEYGLVVIKAVVNSVGGKESRLKRFTWQGHGKLDVVFVQVKRIAFVHKHVLFSVLFLLFFDLFHQDTLSVTM